MEGLELLCFLQLSDSPLSNFFLADFLLDNFTLSPCFLEDDKWLLPRECVLVFTAEPSLGSFVLEVDSLWSCECWDINVFDFAE